MNPLLLDIPDTLESDRLRLRPYVADDGEWLHRIYLENRGHLGEAIAGMKIGMGLDMTNRNDAELFVRQRMADWINRTRFVYGMWQKMSNNYRGELWIENRDWNMGIHEVGYFLIQEQVRQGFATEAARRGLSFIFDDLNATKAALTCDEDNVASYRVAERCGFRREGCLRHESKKSNGAMIGKLVYGLLKEEFNHALTA